MLETTLRRFLAPIDYSDISLLYMFELMSFPRTISCKGKIAGVSLV